MDEGVNVMLITMVCVVICSLCFALAVSGYGIIAKICSIAGIVLLTFIVLVIITLISVSLYRWMKDETD